MADCNCGTCKAACTSKPGWFLPGEAEKVAEELGLSLKELFDKYLGVDWYTTSEGDIFVLAPAIEEMLFAGTEYPGDPRGECVFYSKGECLIHNSKPHECREYIHTEIPPTTSKRHKAVAEAWKDKQDQIIELLEREPECGEFNFLDLF